ncbi:hypothetical protein ACQ4PT_045803 [Festuca glaucescens]
MDHQEQEGAAANGFGRCWLQVAEARALWNVHYPIPPDMRCPGGWVLSRGGLPVPPVPTRSARAVAIYDHFWGQLTPEERNDPRWSPDNNHAWTAFFEGEREDRLAAYDGSGDPPANNNASGRRRWWSAPGRTLAWVLSYIADGNDLPLQMCCLT